MVKGNDLTVTALASIYDADSGTHIAFNLDGCTNLRMRLVRSFNRIDARSVSVNGDEVAATFAGSTLSVGTYGIEISFKKDGQDGRIFEDNLFAIVADSGDASAETATEGGSGEGYNITVNIKSRALRIGQVSGITDYDLLDNRPLLNGRILTGNQSAHDLGLATTEALAAKVDKEAGKGLSKNDYTDSDKAKVDKLETDGSANEYLSGSGTYTRPVKQGYGTSVAEDGTVAVDPQVIARQSDVSSVSADLAAQKAKEQDDIDKAGAAISKEETDRKAAVKALQGLIDTLNADSNVDGSVKKTVADAVAKVVAGAPEDLDTLKEIADYIASDKTGAAQMAAAISKLQTLTEGHTSDIDGLKESAATKTELDTGLGGKVDKEKGKGLSANDYTDDDKAKLAGVEEGAQKNAAPDAEMSETSTNAVQNKAVKVYVDGRNLTVAEAIVSLAARLDALEGSRGLLGDATAGTIDVSGLTKCRYPTVLYGHGVPAGANVPVNLPDGLPWDGVPAFVGQIYINLDAASGGLYYAVGVDSVADWKQA